MFVFGLKVAWRLVRQKLLLDALSQTITRDEAVETGFLPQSIFQVCRLQEQLLLWLIQQTGEVPVGPFNLPAQILRPPGCRLEPAAEGFHIITRDAPPPVSDTQCPSSLNILVPLLPQE